MVNPKVPPHNTVAEQSVLGAVLLDKDAVVDVAEFLKPSYFYDERHGKIFESMLTLYENHEPIDTVTVVAQLKKNGDLKAVGGASLVNELLNVVPTSAHAEKYGRIIHELYIKRMLIESAAMISELAFQEEGEAQELLDEAESKIFAIAQHATKRDFLAIKDAL